MREAWDQWDVRWVFAAAPLLRGGGKLVAFCPTVRFGSLMQAAAQTDLPYLTYVAWRKPNPMPQYHGRLAQALECALIFGRGDLAARGEHNVWDGCAERLPPDAPGYHPYRKPEALMRWLCRLVTPCGGTVLDPFAGSGSTVAAAALEGFDAIGIETDARYCEAARRRAAAAAQPRLMLVDAGGCDAPAHKPPPAEAAGGRGARRILGEEGWACTSGG